MRLGVLVDCRTIDPEVERWLTSWFVITLQRLRERASSDDPMRASVATSAAPGQVSMVMAVGDAADGVTTKHWPEPTTNDAYDFDADFVELDRRVVPLGV